MRVTILGQGPHAGAAETSACSSLRKRPVATDAEPEKLIPQITQESLADMIGTTRSRVSFFMNRFRKMGFIDYNGRIQVHKSLLNVILHDQLPGHNAEKPPIVDTLHAQSKPAKSRRVLASKIG